MSKRENFIFHSYELQKHSSFEQNLFLFNKVKHLQLQSPKNWRIYETLDEEFHSVKMRIAIHISGEFAQSPLKAPFGFLEMYKATTASELNYFFLQIETDLRIRGVRKILFKSYPELYNRKSSMTEVALKRLGFSTSQEISSMILVDRKPFERKIKISERQKLRKAKILFSFERVKEAHVKEIYSFIEVCRNEKGQHLSMSLSDLRKTIKQFPKNFYFFRVGDPEGNAAAAIVIKVSEKILYTFYYAHAKKFDKVSPVVFLMAGIYDWAREEKFSMIDLGTSMQRDKVDLSLLHFKRSIGGQNTRKLIFEKNLL